MSQVGEKDFTKLLNQGHGYGIVVGLGFAFALIMVGLTWVQAKFTRMNPNAASEFATASRSIKAGLICCGITSAWTWSATLLQSSTATYQSGLSAAWWYGVGGTIQIAIFSMIAAKVKMNANGATTFLQIVKARFGVPCHLLFTFYALVCVNVVCGSLVLGASATVNALTGMSVEACNFLLPIGIAVYVIAGGLRATFICDFIHTTMLFTIIYIFVFTAYGTSDVLGSPGKMWDLLQEASVANPVLGNVEGSYLTLRSNSGVVFAACTIASGFSGVFCDQGYWQRAIASRPESTTRAYMLGALSWFSIPWGFGTVMGLGARALQTNPNFPTYPYALSASQQSAGLAAPAAAVTMLGKGGAVAILLATFMAATSASSAELIAVSSIVVYDILGTYWKPLSGRQVIFYSHIIIAVWAVWMGCWATILHKAGIDLGWLFYIQGVALTPAVVPIGLTVCWKRLSFVAVFWGTLFGTVCGMLGWMIGCWKIYGSINIPNLAEPYSAISGSAPGLVLSTVATLLLSWIFPSNYDWQGTRAIASATQDEPSASSEESSINEKDESGKERNGPLATTSYEVASKSDDSLDRTELQRVFKRAAWISGLLTFVITILIPMPMFGQSYVFSRKFFTGWISISIIWLLLAGASCILLPIWESRNEIRLIISGLTGLRKKNHSSV